METGTQLGLKQGRTSSTSRPRRGDERTASPAGFERVVLIVPGFVSTTRGLGRIPGRPYYPDINGARPQHRSGRRIAWLRRINVWAHGFHASRR